MSLASLLKKGSLRGLATATPATVATVKPDISPSVATVATVTVAKSKNPAANDPAIQVQAPPDDSTTAALDPDRWCWPHGEAMTGTEIDTFTARLVRFSTKGVIHADAEQLADKLVTRDREADDRRLCLECTHLAGHAGTWGCRGWQRAGVAMKVRDAGLPGELVCKLQRCDGFKP